MAGLALGLAAVSRMVYSDAQAGGYRDPAVYAAVLLFCVGLWPFLVALGDALKAVAISTGQVYRVWFPVIAKVEPPKPAAPADPSADDLAWRTALDRFFRAGQAAEGFSGAKLAGVVGSDGWPTLVHFYEELGILRDWGSNRGYDWRPPWGLDRVLLRLGSGALPHPPGLPPNVEPYIAPQRRAARKIAEQPTVLEHAQRPVPDA